MTRITCGWLAVSLFVWMTATPVAAQEPIGGPSSEASPPESLEAMLLPPPLWHYGGFVDLGYSVDFNFPGNHLWRNRSTTPHVNELDLNMAGIYLRKDATPESRWGVELLGQTGEDSTSFGFAVGLSELGGSSWLRHFGRANASYLAPVGNGLTIQAGIFNSFIGYESLYSKDNNNYTRAWIADYSPYLMLGVNAVYPFNDQWTGAFFIINDYFHLEHANDVPSYGGQVAYKPSQPWTMKETLYYGPDQANTSIEFWRLFSDTIVEWKGEEVTVALDYQIGTQKNASAPGHPRDFYTGSALELKWHIEGPWTVALRPEFWWDRNGLMSGFEQLVRAVTTTLQYTVPYRWTNTICKLEYRYDESTGPGGGFFKGTENALTAGQQMLIFSVVGTFDSP